MAERLLRRMELYNSNRPIDVVAHWRKEGCLLLEPPYQRGDVWGPLRRTNLIRSLMQGIPIPSIIVNNRMNAEWDDDYRYAVIDGRQRITTILMFLDDRICVPGEWFGETEDVLFSHLPIASQRNFRNMPMAFSEGSLRSLEDEQTVFELVNFGGVPQGQSDL